MSKASLHVSVVDRILLIFRCFLLSCFISACDAPGEGSKAEKGFTQGRRIIDALERYRAERGKYPDALLQLKGYVNESDFVLKIHENNFHEFKYEKTNNGYSLEFSYGGPGINYCFYLSFDRNWACYGHY